jgi:uncharacterized membrane protein YqjE
VIASLGRFFPLLLRHLDAYGDIAGVDTREAVAHLVARVMAGVIAAGCLLLAAMMICVWLVALTWDKSWGAWVPAGLAAAFLVAALVMLVPLLDRRRPHEPLFPRVRREWRRDRELMERAVSSLREAERESTPQ